MTVYHAPLEDWLFILHDLWRVQDRGDLPGFEDLTPDFTRQVLDAAARFHVDVLHPLNESGDAQGARLEAGAVRTPAGFREAWTGYREAGWHRLSLPAALGGAGLPPVMSVPVTELRAATGHSFSMYSSFCAPTASMVAALGEPWMREHVVPRLSDGEWTATMCMTEPQAGTDLRQLRTRAVAREDGSWRIDGEKIFISGGDHDLTGNIVHVVLAKVVDEQGKVPASLSAVNVFLVPKRRIDPATGALGGPNGVHVRGIEHKMGIEGSATCALSFEDAQGWRIGGAGGTGTAANMAPMFHLMNYARIGTAMSGVAYADLALQNAIPYAHERLSGRAGPVAAAPDKAGDPLVAHADVRRLLLESGAFADAARAGAMRAAIWQTEAREAADPGVRARAQDLLEVLTPVMKAFYTDRGFDATVACQQVLGGHGYIRDHGIERLVRNARIGQLYEGANGIQAADLVQRKLAAHGGRAGRRLLAAIDAFVQTQAQRAGMDPFVRPLRAGTAAVSEVLDWLGEHAAAEPHAASAGAYDLLTALGILYLGWTWAEIAATLTPTPSSPRLSEDARRRKIALAHVWMERQMPLIDPLCRRARSGNAGLLMLADALI